MNASAPFTSRCFTTMLWYSPVSSTAMPLSRVMRAAPPPMDSPRTTVSWPVASVTRMSTVLEWSVASSSTGTNAKCSPACSASAKESRMRTSSAAKPSMPASSARSVPWPW